MFQIFASLVTCKQSFSPIFSNKEKDILHTISIIYLLTIQEKTSHLGDQPKSMVNISIGTLEYQENCFQTVVAEKIQIKATSCSKTISVSSDIHVMGSTLFSTQHRQINLRNQYSSLFPYNVDISPGFVILMLKIKIGIPPIKTGRAEYKDNHLLSLVIPSLGDVSFPIKRQEHILIVLILQIFIATLAYKMLKVFFRTFRGPLQHFSLQKDLWSDCQHSLREKLLKCQ